MIAPPSPDDEWYEHLGILRAKPARVYDYMLGGKDNFAVDRKAGDDIAKALPTIWGMARQNRAVMHRATKCLTRECGIDQFLDIGAGIQRQPNVHEVAQKIIPMASTVYVDNDPIVLAHARALLDSPRGGRGPVQSVEADLADPKRLLADPTLQETLDLDRPVGLLLLAVLMWLGGDQDPWDCAHVLMDALPSGSYVAISHLGSGFDKSVMSSLQVTAKTNGMTLIPRAKADVERFFDGWTLVEPGVVSVTDWMPETEEGSRAYYWAGVARKP